MMKIAIMMPYSEHVGTNWPPANHVLSGILMSVSKKLPVSSLFFLFDTRIAVTG